MNWIYKNLYAFSWYEVVDNLVIFPIMKLVRGTTGTPVK